MSELIASRKPRIYLRAPISYYGGKQTMLPIILPLVPPHHKYVEPFLGGGAVFWAKEPAPVEVVNDLDSFVANFYKVCKTDFEPLKALVDATVFGRESHDEAATIRQRPAFFSPVQRAWAFFVLANCSLYSILDNSCNAPGKDAKASNTFYRKVERFDASFCERFRNVFVEQRDAIYVLCKNDAPDTFAFVDPPYFNADMGHYGGYTEADFEALLLALGGLVGKFMLTSYPSPLLEAYTERFGWRFVRKEMSLSAGAKGKKKVEFVTMNY